MSDSILDLEALLAPFETGDGVGEDPRADESANPIYHRLKDAQKDARAEERRRDSEPGGDAAPPAQWRDVLRLGTEVLTTRGKDLEVASFMVQALVRLYGLPGLAAGIELLDGLVDRYWTTAFPPPEEDLGWDEQQEYRGDLIGGLSGKDGDGTIMQPLRMLPLFQRPDGAPATLHLWSQAEDVEKITDSEKREELQARGTPTIGTLTGEGRAAATTLKKVGLGARSCRAAWVALGGKLDELLGRNAPSMRRVFEVLERIEQVAVAIVGELEDRSAAEDDPGSDHGMAEDSGHVGGASGPGGTGGRGLRSRDDVIRQIEEAAEWFRRMEPHSPLAFTLTDAARRARLPLPELLEEVLPDAEARRAMLTALGIRFQENDGSEE